MKYAPDSLDGGAGGVGGRFHDDARYPAPPGLKLLDHGGEDDGRRLLQ
jgi:hypothetical protein